MKKHVYRAIALSDWDLATFSEKVKERGCILGVDVAKEDFVAVVMDPERCVQAAIKWQHPQETPRLVEIVTGELAGMIGAAVMESSGTYGDVLRHALAEKGLPVLQVAPKRTHDAAEVFDGVPSLHDVKAAVVIGRLHFDGASHPWPLNDLQRRTWRAEVDTLALFEGQRQRCLNRLEGLLARHWPELAAILPLTSVTLSHLLWAFGSPRRVAEQRSRAETLMHRVGGAQLAGEKITEVLDSAEATIGVPCREAERVHLQVVAGQAVHFRKCAKGVQQRLAARCEKDPATQDLAAAIGRKSAAVLFALLGSPKRYPNAGSYLEALGLNLTERSSGKKKGALRLAKRGSGTARRYLYLAALRLIARERGVKCWYEAKVARDGGVKIKAVVAVMRKLAKGLWHVGQGTAFDPNRLFNAELLTASRHGGALADMRP
jgi:transposase